SLAVLYRLLIGEIFFALTPATREGPLLGHIPHNLDDLPAAARFGQRQFPEEEDLLEDLQHEARGRFFWTAAGVGRLKFLVPSLKVEESDPGYANVADRLLDDAQPARIVNLYLVAQRLEFRLLMRLIKPAE